MWPLLLALSAPTLLGMGDKPDVTVRFFVEANANDTDKFATPIRLQNPPREAFIEKIPAIHEREFRAVYPFRAKDGSWGCAFSLDQSGRIDLEVLSTGRRGSSVVVFLATKAGTHQVVDMLIDKPIHDGIISIPYGLTDLEIAAITKSWPVIGQKKKR